MSETTNRTENASFETHASIQEERKRRRWGRETAAAAAASLMRHRKLGFC